MGGAVSSGRDNGDLVDNLIEAKYIVTKQAENAFRAVDRGDYFLEEFRDSAYKDCAWRQGPLHLSAPCIYTKVVEALDLRPGLAFLNLGSGTGYLSTVVGLLLGSRGINHGVELQAEAVAYAETKLSEFKKNALAFDEFDFCEPVMVTGNCLQLGGCSQYDRVYCGAACPEEHLDYIKSLIKIGGIVVVPVDDKLLRIHRTGEASWESRSILSVSFATLVSTESSSTEIVCLAEPSVPSLRNICRTHLRAVFRAKLMKNFPQPDFRRPKRADGSDSEASIEGSRSPSRTEFWRGRGTDRGNLLEMLYHLQRSGSSSSRSSSSEDAEDHDSDSEAGEGGTGEGADLQHSQHLHPLPDHDAHDCDEPPMQSTSVVPKPVLPAMEIPLSEKENGVEPNRPEAYYTDPSLTAGMSKRKADGYESLPAGCSGSSGSSGCSSSTGSSHGASKRRHMCVHCRRAACLPGSATDCELPPELTLSDSSSGSAAAARSAAEQCAHDSRGADRRSSPREWSALNGEIASDMDVAEAASDAAPKREATAVQCATTDDDDDDASAAAAALAAAAAADLGALLTADDEDVSAAAAEARPVQPPLHLTAASDPRQESLDEAVLPHEEERVQRQGHVIQLSLGGPPRGAAARAIVRRGDWEASEQVVLSLFREPAAAAVGGRRGCTVSEPECMLQSLGECDGDAAAHEESGVDSEEAEFVLRRQAQRDYHQTFTSSMVAFVEALPLPDGLKVFLTYGRRKTSGSGGLP